MNKYSVYKDSEIAWIGKIPIHWKIAKTKRISTIHSGATPNSNVKEYWGGEINWYTPADVGSDNSKKILDTSIRKITELGLSSSSCKLVPENSLVLTTRAPVGNVAISNEVFTTNQGCRALTPTSQCKAEFLYYYFLTQSNSLNVFGNGTTFVELTKDNLGMFPVPLPPISEQDQIVKYLDEKTTKVDSLINRLKKKIDLLKEYRMTLVGQCVTKGLNPAVEMKDSGIEWIGAIPVHWGVLKLKHRYQVTLGKMLTSRDRGGMVQGPYLRSQNVQDGFFDLSDVNLMWFNSTELKRLRLKPGDLLINEGGQVGRCAIWNGDIDPCFFQNSLNRVRAEIGCINFVFYLFQLYFHTGYFESIVDRVSIPHLTREKLIEVKLPNPPLSEQLKITKYLDNNISNFDALVDKIERKIELLREYRQTLISNVVTGKIRVTKENK